MFGAFIKEPVHILFSLINITYYVFAVGSSVNSKFIIDKTALLVSIDNAF